MEERSDDGGYSRRAEVCEMNIEPRKHPPYGGMPLGAAAKQRGIEGETACKQAARPFACTVFGTAENESNSLIFSELLSSAGEGTILYISLSMHYNFYKLLCKL